KLVAGQDALSLRPTVLLALALQSASDGEREELKELLLSDQPASLRVGRLRRTFQEHDVFAKAEALVDKSRARAEAVADEVEPEPLRQLLYFLVDTVLAPEEAPPPIDPAVL